MTEQATIALHDVDALIFDLGGVILPLQYGATVRSLSELFGADASLLYGRLAQQPFFDAFERGTIAANEFRRELRAKMLDVVPDARPAPQALPTDRQLDDAWNALLLSIPEENLELLIELKQQHRTFLLSNTNEIHLERFLSDFKETHPARAPFEQHFEHAHYSHLLKMRKPDHEIYQALLDRHGLTASRTVFIDDNPHNVAAAKQLGILAFEHTSNARLCERFRLG